MNWPGASSPLGLRDRRVERPQALGGRVHRATVCAAGRRRRSPGRRPRRCPTSGTCPGTAGAPCRSRPGRRRPGCPRRWRPPTARCRRCRVQLGQQGQGGEHLEGARRAQPPVRVAGRRAPRPCRGRRAGTRRRRRLGSAVAPGASTTSPVLASAAPRDGRRWLRRPRAGGRGRGRRGPRHARAPGVDVGTIRAAARHRRHSRAVRDAGLPGQQGSECRPRTVAGRSGCRPALA